MGIRHLIVRRITMAKIALVVFCAFASAKAFSDGYSGYVKREAEAEAEADADADAYYNGGFGSGQNFFQGYAPVAVILVTAQQDRNIDNQKNKYSSFDVYSSNYNNNLNNLNQLQYQISFFLPKLQNPRLQNPRFQNPSRQNTRLQNPRRQNTRLQNPRPFNFSQEATIISGSSDNIPFNDDNSLFINGGNKNAFKKFAQNFKNNYRQAIFNKQQQENRFTPNAQAGDDDFSLTFNI